jgi:Domain of unknown function (DUF4288)
MRATWKWYGVKTLHRTEVRGRPGGRDAHYSNRMALVEERVVVLRARSFEEAIEKAEAEAKEYARGCQHRNPYGQRVRSRYLGYRSAYVFYDGVDSGTEVFSTTEVVPRSVSDRAIVRRAIESQESRRATRARRNILDIVFNAPAPGVVLTRSECVFVERHRTLKRRSNA